MTHPHEWPEPQCEKIHGPLLLVVWTLCIGGSWLMVAMIWRALAHLVALLGSVRF